METPELGDGEPEVDPEPVNEGDCEGERVPDEQKVLLTDTLAVVD